VIAAPVFERSQIVAALAIMGTAVSLAGEAEDEAATALTRIAAALSQDLG
jgi:DNA-binding IclR family transcriptional regulator